MGMRNVSFHFDIGDKVKDKRTGMVGVIVALTLHESGVQHYLVQPTKLTLEGGYLSSVSILGDNLSSVRSTADFN